VAAFLIAAWGGAHLYPHQVMATVPAGQAVGIKHTLWHPFAGTRAGELYGGDAVQTGAEGATLQRGDGTELRLSANTRVWFDSPSSVRLGRGSLYVQTRDVQDNRDLIVTTDLGSVEHLGTQYLVERGNDALVVAVREGRVLMHYPQHPAVELRDGQAASVDPRGKLRRWDLSAFDNLWDWTDVLALPLIIDGQSLYGVLTSIAQRSGLALRFSSPSAESAARSLALHGAPLELPPRDALAAVLATTSLSGTTIDREILVSSR
jgi:ferric-dicitrate binding protein FerR (iron transport regulator)